MRSVSEICRILSSAREEMLRAASEHIREEKDHHKTIDWFDNSQRNTLKDVWNNCENMDITTDELISLGRDKLKDFGFSNWDGILMLIPLWVWNFISPESVIWDIYGKEIIKNQDTINLETRRGLIAYGIKI